MTGDPMQFIRDLESQVN